MPSVHVVSGPPSGWVRAVLGESSSLLSKQIGTGRKESWFRIAQSHVKAESRAQGTVKSFYLKEKGLNGVLVKVSMNVEIIQLVKEHPVKY